MKFLSCIFTVACGSLFTGSCLAQTWPSSEQIFAKGAIIESDDAFAARDFVPQYRAFLPVAVDLSRYFPTPGFQAGLGSCTAWAVGYAARAYYELSAGGDKADPSNIPSPAYIFNSTVQSGARICSGSQVTDALDLLKKGALSLADAPYDGMSCTKPSVADRDRAIGFRILKYDAVDPKALDRVKGQLARGDPVVIVIASTPTFEHLRAEQVYDSAPDATDLHAVTLVGYDDERQAFKLINSWGTWWGNGGFGWISYRAFAKDVPRAYVMRPLLANRPRPFSSPVADITPSPLSPRPPTPPTPVLAPKPTVEVSKLDPPLPRPPSPRPPNPVAELTKPIPPGPLAPKPTPQPITSLEFQGCGAVESRPGPTGPTVTGFVGSEADLEELKRRGQGVGIAKFDVAVRPWPQCEALLTLGRGLKAAERPSIRVVRPAPDAALISGSALVIEVESPAAERFVHVTYIQADGKAVHLLQPDNLSLRPVAPRVRMTLGDGRDGGPRFTVSPPFGTEMVVVVASAAPLFSEPRPQVETEREFLSALRAAVIARPDPAAPQRLFSAAFDSVRTVERRP